MKNKTNTRLNTRINDIQKRLHADRTDERATARRDMIRKRLEIDLVGGQVADYENMVSEYRALITEKHDAQVAWMRVPASRRKWADEAIQNAIECAERAIAQAGGEYSGQMSTRTEWMSTACAWTHTSAGDQYSRKCKYRRTDATHTVHLDARRVLGLLDRSEWVEASRRDGLPLIALDKDGACVWVRSAGKRIESVSGWMAYRQGVTFHSTTSREHAEQGLARKWKKQSEQIKLSRRTRLVARMCKGATATVQDARDMGYCVPGIEQFRARHSIGETATLPELVATGDPQAVALAFSLARAAIAKAPKEKAKRQ